MDRLSSYMIFTRDASEDGFSSDAGGVEVDNRGGGLFRIIVGDALGDALVGSGGVVVGRVFGQDVSQVVLGEDLGVVEYLPLDASDEAFADGVGTGCLGWAAQDPQSAVLEYGVEGIGELRRCPHSEFSRAMRRIRALAEAGVRGRPLGRRVAA